MYENIIKPIQIWYPRNRTDPKNKVVLSFGAHSEIRKIQAHKKTAQMRFFTNFTAFGIFFPLPSTRHGIFNTISMKCNLLRRK
ncbi:hypothetical protein GDO81_019646 [Engystomops pustulosus]|uniref:Uncharacterized protein n=1 Tax=Engystomops pustulosus TaxID=76066 RepID=A0AAV6YS78_ENGPU|nr:hypothetical protein GDO81_019646 [Engystomops pustulosus]